MVSRLHRLEQHEDPGDDAARIQTRARTADGSLVAEAILPQFLRLAHPLGTGMALIRVVVPSVVKSVPTEEAPAAPGNAAPTMERMLDEADSYLRSVAALPVFEGLKVMTTVRTGEPPDEIIASAREVDADVIAMTTHGRTGLKGLLFGSVAEAALRMADVPPFMLRAAQLEAAVRVA